MGLFIWGRWRYDVVALVALAIAVTVGAVPFDDIYSGLANPAVITVACVMIISQAITHSGILAPLINKLSRFAHRPVLSMSILIAVTAVLSAFMNNVGALALMMPIAIQTAIDHDYSPSMILMPLAFAAGLGGLTTMIGTPPNLLIATYRGQLTGHPFTMFDFSHVGILTALAGVVFIALVGWRLIPGNRKAPRLPEDIFQIQDYITEIYIPENSPVAGMTIAELEKKVQSEFEIMGLIRNKRKRIVFGSDQTLQAKDLLIVEASAKELQKLLDAGKLELAADKKISTETLRDDNIALLEAVVPQASRIEGRSSRSMQLRSRFQINLLAIARQGQAIKQRLSQVSLRGGDVVLLQGPSDTLRANSQRMGFLPLVERGVAVGKRQRTWLPVSLFFIAILLAAFQLLPVQVAFSGAILAMLVLNAIPVRTLYESVEWPIIILLAAMIPIGSALQSTGGTALIAHYFIILSGHVSPIIILGLLLVVTMTVSDFMNNAATTVVMAPIGISIAQALKLNIDPFLMAVAIGASCSFLTPVGHQNNTLVLGPGGYRFSDYVRVGLPLEVIVLITSLPLILWIWPLR